MEGFRCQHEQKVIWRDQDALGHVNNAVYATYFEIGRFEWIRAVMGPDHTLVELILAELTITYKSQAHLGETLIVGSRVPEIRNSSFMMEGRIEEKETGRLVATSRAVLVYFDYTANRAVPLPKEWREAIARYEGREF